MVLKQMILFHNTIMYRDIEFYSNMIGSLPNVQDAICRPS